MTERIAISQIVVDHGNDRIIVKPGETYDFDDEEAARLDALKPAVVRVPEESQPARPQPARRQPAIVRRSARRPRSRMAEEDDDI